jgi:GT2 family glycosyltransferase
VSEQAWRIVDLDLADGPREAPASRVPLLIVLWWRGLPLGARAFLAAETPMSAEEVLLLAAPMLAELAAVRGAPEPPKAGVDAAPRSGPTLAEAIEADVLAILDREAALPAPAASELSVVVCTRDRDAMLARCLDTLADQTSPPGQMVVVDNSASGGARTVCASRDRVTYVHEPRPGLSRARNAGVRASRGAFVAFTDDDVELPRNWTQEIVRAFSDPRVEAVSGLVLPARLDTPAQRAFELDLGGFTSRFTPLLFDRSFLDLNRGIGPQVWRIGAGANMAFRRAAFARFGGFDERLGAGASGCSEDSEYWCRILAGGGLCLYEPRAYVRHHHRADWASLRRQVRAYMRGHVSALVVQADRHGERGNVRRIFRQLPAYFARTALQSTQNLAGWRLRLLAEEVIGWTLGLQYLLRPRWRRGGDARARLAVAGAQKAVRHG